MRPHALLLPLALCSASLAAAPLPSYEFATQHEQPKPRVQMKAKAAPLNVEPRIRLENLERPLIEVKPAPPYADARGSPRFADSFSISKSLSESGPVQLQPRNSGFSPHPAQSGLLPSLQPGMAPPGADGKQRAIPMQLLPPLPYQRMR
ncbi:hypothetical protein [Chromobacterium violaceum]|uniref:hypothetical protein n=1 Tax=Chromobacterium violaceum TaxID=536 RepID=UPI001C8BC506|nr:hypothetical protein [Chromobacterium violaceum]MBX9268691.1 hypothetical protein [Chromobacterium violaceum]